MLLARPPAAAQSSCDESFADQQLSTADRLIGENNYTGAVRLINTAMRECNIDRVQNALTETYSTWNQYVQRAPSGIPTFLSSVTSNEYLNRSAFGGRITARLQAWVGRLHDNGSYGQAYQFCTRYSGYSSRTFRLNYLCGSAAYRTENHQEAIAAYETIVNDWNEEQSYVTWDDAASDLKELYMITTAFDKAFDIAKRLAIRNPTPENVLTSLITVRGQMLSPIARHGNVLFRGVTSDEATSHVRREMQQIRFPNFVVGVYLMTRDARSDVIFYDSGTIAPPSTSDLERLSGNVTMLESSENPDEAWLISPVDAGYFVVQFESRTTPEENALLEGLLADIQNNQRWQDLVAQQLSRSYAATGSAVGTLIGGAYLADRPLNSFAPLFEDSNALLYLAVQDAEGRVVHSQQFERSNLAYDQDLWERTTTTPALYHHEVRYAGQRAYEVVWPNYQGDEWAGVVRVGIQSN
jgi:tetratricopeptide (TPR) repeat protein